MVENAQPTSPMARAFPDGVPILVDLGAGVTLRAHETNDVAGIVEACNDPDVVRWTTVPTPPGGYARSDAEEFLELVAQGWTSGEALNWVVEVARDGQPQFAGGVTLTARGDGEVELGFLLHPAARGRGVMSSAVRLVRDYAFDVLGVEVIRWRAVVGNWGSRRVAAAAGFVFDGTVRRTLVHRGSRLDGWVATITRDDPRTPLSWLPQPVLSGGDLTLRPFAEPDADRIVEACADPRTRHFLVSMPQPYGRADALDFIEHTHELLARRAGLVWCIADPQDRCVGSISLEGLGGYSRRAEIGYWAHPEARGRGLVTAAARLVTAYAEETDLVDSIVIRCAAGNLASRQVAIAAGYAQAGVLPACEPLADGELADLVIYSRP